MPLMPAREGSPAMPNWSSNCCPRRLASDCDTRIGTPARNSLDRLAVGENTSPRVKKFTRRMLVDVPTAEGGNAERAPGIW